MLSFGRINGNWVLFFRFSPTLIFSNMIYLLDLLSRTQVDSVISSSPPPLQEGSTIKYKSNRHGR